jgi:uncharacterized protein
LPSLGIGEAVVTVLSERGAPTPVAWTKLRSPRSLMAAIGDVAIGAAAEASPLHNKYGTTKDSDSAAEKLEAKKTQAQANQPAEVGSKTSPAAAKKPGWFRRFVNSRGFQTFLKAVGTELIRSLFGGGNTRRR